MAQKRIKHTDQEWFDLITECRRSQRNVKVWCEQHGITVKAFIIIHSCCGRRGIQSPQKLPQVLSRKSRRLSVWMFPKCSVPPNPESPLLSQKRAGPPSALASMESTWKLQTMQAGNFSQICSKSCWNHVRRSFRGIKTLSGHGAYRYAPLHRWTDDDHPGYLSDGPLCECALSLLRQKIRPPESTAS